MKLYEEERMKVLREAFEHLVLDLPHVQTKKMFGAPSFTVKRKLFAILVTDGIVLTKLSEENRKELQRRPSASIFSYKQRMVQKWVKVSITSKADLEAIMPFVKKSYDAALANATTK